VLILFQEESMPRIRCHYVDCVFLDDGYCGAAAVEIDPDMGCMTYSRANDVETEDEWDEEEELDEVDDWEEVDVDEEDDDLYLDEDEY
jgi:hypothetical protein